MVALSYSFTRTTWVLSQINSRDGIPPPPQHHHPFQSHVTSIQKDSQPFSSSQTQPSPPSPSSSNRISPAVLFIIVILAVIFFISGFLHLLVRFLVKKRPFASWSSHPNGHPANLEASGSEALQRQLQQLFHLHDAGLDQAFIDALPVFHYREIVGPNSKEPFDCAVCLCEFAAEDPLRLLPVCGHAFHLNCIDTWLLSNSTCPLCRGALFVPGLAIENPVFDFEDPREEDGSVGGREFPLPAQKPEDLEEIVVEKRVFPVRLGKFKSLSNPSGDVEGDDVNGSAICNARREEGESSSSNLDARRCYSMGSYQYILGDANLQVELHGGSKSGRVRGLSGSTTADEGVEGKRLCIGSKGESFSVSKIWLWSNKKGKFPMSSDTSLDGGLPWMGRGIEDT